MELIKNHIYLVQEREYQLRSPITMTIVLITNTAYHYYINNYFDTKVWILKTDFQTKYSIYEDITDIISDNIKDKHPSSEYISCDRCNGKGTIPDSTSTSGRKICPKCWGASFMAIKQIL
jgi:hypothetical protein